MMPTAISSAEWLQDDAQIWRLRRAKQVRDKHVAMRWRASPYALGKIPRRPTLETAGLDMIALSNSNKWEPWLSIRTSTVTPDPKEGDNPGLGLFAARAFQFDDIVTRYCGKTTGVDTKLLKSWEKHKWKQFYTFKGKQYAVCPDCSEKKDIYNTELLFAAHLINHSDDPNCQVDPDTFLVKARRDIKRNEELTINYNRDSNHRKKKPNK